MNGFRHYTFSTLLKSINILRNVPYLQTNNVLYILVRENYFVIIQYCETATVKVLQPQPVYDS